MPTFLLLSIWVIAARPFLPAGQGGLILIAGGLSMTALAMLVLMSRHHPIPTGQRPRAAPTTAPEQRKAAASATPAVSAFQVPKPERTEQIARLVHPTDRQLVWPAYVRQAAGKLGLHNTEVLSVEKTRCVIEVRHCRSCARGRSCEAERRRLLRAARRLSRRARVRELQCNLDGRKVCRFHVDMGGDR